VNGLEGAAPRGGPLRGCRASFPAPRFNGSPRFYLKRHGDLKPHHAGCGALSIIAATLAARREAGHYRREEPWEF
jgi:hypothetical protein